VGAATSRRGVDSFISSLEARAAGQSVRLSRTEEFIPAGDHFRVRFVVTPPTGWNAEVELKLTWEIGAAGG
jgi:hypothetical protein